MSEPIFNPKLPAGDHRRREWVSLDAGRVCVVEMSAADTLFVLERSQAPRGDGKILAGDAMLWQVMRSCYAGEEPDAAPIFDAADIPRIQQLRHAEWSKLLAAIERVNGLSAAEVPRLEDFTGAAMVDSSRS